MSVGDRIWTDGRCVYGHFQESQQPQVITAQEEEGIPIVISMTGKTYRLMTFQKNKLKDVAEVRYEDGKLKLYNYINGEFVFASDMELKADKWTDWSLMINDFRKTAFLYDYGTHIKSHFYKPDNLFSEDARHHFITDTELIARNIDKVGNQFDMVIRKESYLTPTLSIKQTHHKSVDILRNGEVVKSVPLQPIINDIGLDQAYGHVGFGVDGSPQAFIEDEQTWSCWIYVESESYYSYPEANLIPARKYRRCLLSANGVTIAEEIIFDSYYIGLDPASLKPRHHNEGTITMPGQITRQLQDGYYWKAQDFFGGDDILGITPSVPDWKDFSIMTFYTPKNEELFKAVLPIYGQFLICKISGGHLLYVSHSIKGILQQYLGTDTYKGVPAIVAGLHFIKNGKLTAIEPQISNVINQRLRPMKKISRWQNRLKLIEIEQHEI